MGTETRVSEEAHVGNLTPTLLHPSDLGQGKSELLGPGTNSLFFCKDQSTKGWGRAAGPGGAAVGRPQALTEARGGPGGCPRSKQALEAQLVRAASSVRLEKKQGRRGRSPQPDGVTQSQASWMTGGSWGSSASHCSAGTLGSKGPCPLSGPVLRSWAWPSLLPPPLQVQEVSTAPRLLPAALLAPRTLPGEASRAEPGLGVRRL